MDKLCCAVPCLCLCFAVLCFAVLCFALRCFALLCGALLCGALLCRVCSAVPVLCRACACEAGCAYDERCALSRRPPTPSSGHERRHFEHALVVSLARA